MVYRYDNGSTANIYVCERPEFRPISEISESIINEIYSGHQSTNQNIKLQYMKGKMM